jgi:two-component system, OmpR family, alkaline phosphatase synthesis response regulator PhoP
MNDAPVLVIEDDESIRDLVGETLREAGYRVEEAPTGEAGLRRARAETPRLVVLDLLLPGMDGWQVISELRRTAQLERVPVLVVSILDPDPPPASVDGYIAKPFSPSRVVDKVAELSGPPSGGVAA